jgi:hypothetical protein
MAKKVPPAVVEQILKLDAEGVSQRRIAKEVGLRHETICRILRKYHDMAFDRIIGQLAAVRSRHVARLEHAADLAMQAFSGSGKPAASFLTEYRGALADIRAVLGIANRIDPGGGMPAAGSDEVTAALEELQRIEDKRRGEQPQTPVDTRYEDDAEDDDQDRGSQD